MNDSKLNQIIEILSEAIKSYDLSENDVQGIIDLKDQVQADFPDFLRKYFVGNKKFGEPVYEFELLVPENYNQTTWIDKFKKANSYRQSRNPENVEYLTSANFSKTTTQLVPGKKYAIKFFPYLRKDVTHEDCIAFLLSHNALLVGVHGLFLAQEKADYFSIPQGILYSPDYEENLPSGSNGNKLCVEMSSIHWYESIRIKELIKQHFPENESPLFSPLEYFFKQVKYLISFQEI